MPEDTRARLFTPVIFMGAAERYEVLLHPPKAGTNRARIERNHWITGKALARREINHHAG